MDTKRNPDKHAIWDEVERGVEAVRAAIPEGTEPRMAGLILMQALADNVVEIAGFEDFAVNLRTAHDMALMTAAARRPEKPGQ